jgi:hypothetical protein
MAISVRHIQRDGAGGSRSNLALPETLAVSRLDVRALVRVHLAVERRIGLRTWARKPTCSALKRLFAGRA